MPMIDLGEAMRNASNDEFWAIRGKAIQAYANIEQSLARIFAMLSGTTQEVAGVIFFRISSTDSRNKILEKLFKKKFNDRFNVFRNSLFEQLRPIDIERNEIVHWNVVNQVGADKEGKTIAKVTLMPPNFWVPDTNTPIKDTAILVAFISKCDFYSKLCNMFNIMVGNVALVPIPDADKQPWLDIFSQPIVYPPPLDHPLSPKPQEHDNPSQSFQLK